METKTELKISVIVCTYNRANILSRVLQTLGEQTLPLKEFEIIVVDNNSTDNTRQIVENFFENIHNLRYCFEARQGLSHARNRGWQEARGSYVGYIDDDAKAPAQWLSVAHQIINEMQPAVFGGPYYAYYDSPEPKWWKDSYQSHVQGDEPRFLGVHEYLDGGNIFFPRYILEKFEGFDPDLGMSGTQIGFGEETALQEKIRGNIPANAMYYHPDLFIYHLVMAKKMRLGWIIRQRFMDGRYFLKAQSGFGDAVLGVGRWETILSCCRVLLRVVLETIFAFVFRDRKKYPYYQNHLFERTLNHVRSLGYLYEHYLAE
jgi:glucosyl-dolichyl phosphate glucuronosyltransferase